MTSHKPRLLVVDDEAGIREMLNVLFERAGYDVSVAKGVNPARKLLSENETFDVVLSDLMMPDGTGLEVLSAAHARDQNTQVVVMTAYATTERAVEAMRQGAYDYLEKPTRNDVIAATIEKALERRQIALENQKLRTALKQTWSAHDLIGKSDAIAAVRDLIVRMAPSTSSVLITGQSGTGKEMVARALHGHSPRNGGPFKVINCGALPENLLESELFGHVKGAFTGAGADKEGLFCAASGGTIFLDEIGELPQAMQVKLLRVLQERKVRAVGGQDEIAIDVRVVAATNRDVEKEVAEGGFREDLYYRLNVLRIELPPLRARAEDIPLLAEHFRKLHCTLQEKEVAIDSQAMRLLAAQPYPGNARELQNIIERAVTLAQGGVITVEDLPGEKETTGVLTAPLPPAGFDLDRYLADMEHRMLLRALDQAGGVRTQAAKLLGMSFRTFRYRLAKYEPDE